MDNVITLQKSMPHLVVDAGDVTIVVAVSDVRMIASGDRSIAEYDDPENLGRALAIMALETINGTDR